MPDCFRQPRTVDSELLVPEVLVALWLLGSLGLLAELPLGVCGFWLLVLPLPVLPLCANARPEASVSVNNNFFVMCCSFEVFDLPVGLLRFSSRRPARDIDAVVCLEISK